ncbi:hypothetical protein CYMTET_49008 [Cymbomonas tetramitiformis]|uniref:Core-binding (CB) domain-containing protein n=1 Tax=Cymbomonas tetramitiformis TaxID=36881 RepID=A0AAE0BR61_9CHLO|nr:hypothetical protein CYMTET_49008 [Cymbomonas tetramitiformis]
MSGESYVKAGFELKVDELHEEELRYKRVVPIPSHFAEAVHGVGVVDKDHSNFEKVRVVHNYSENEDWSVNSATDIPEQKWQSAADAMAFLRPKYFMIKVDIKSAYRHLPIALQYLRYHTYRWRGEVVADLRFPFGHRAVPGKFHEVTEALDILEFLGLEVAWDKCEGPVQDVAFLGIRLCTNEFGEGHVSASLPMRKCRALREKALFFSRASMCARKDLDRLLLTAIFKQCVQFDVRFIVEWVPSKQNQFADALSRQEMRLFFDLHQEWKSSSIWRQDRDDWKLFSEVFERLDRRFDGEKRELEDGVAHFAFNAVALNTRSSYKTGGKQFCRFAVWYDLRPIFPASEHSLELWAAFLARSVTYSTIKAYLSAARNLHLELGFTLPEFEELKPLRRTLRGIKRLKGNPKRKKLGIGPKELVSIFFGGGIDLEKENDLFCWLACLLAFGGCFRKANVTAKKQDAFSRSGAMLKASVRFTGKDLMEIVASFSKTNQFSEREHKVALTHAVFDHWLRDKLKVAGLQPDLYSGHSFRRGAATLAFAERMPRNLVKHWGDWVSDAVDEYHEMTPEQRLTIPKLVSDAMAAAVDARR